LKSPKAILKSNAWFDYDVLYLRAMFFSVFIMVLILAAGDFGHHCCGFDMEPEKEK
jgi:hypothetical protein